MTELELYKLEELAKQVEELKSAVVPAIVFAVIAIICVMGTAFIHFFSSMSTDNK